MSWKKLLVPFLLYGVFLGLYAVFSYSLTAPNLILTNWEPYWNFQLYMWKHFFNERDMLTYVYVSLVASIFLGYFYLVRNGFKTLTLPTSSLKLGLLTILLASPLLFSNNALSYDVFNYIFNAKMVMVYQANPHVETATNYLYDDWTRFMHNRHTPAPYGYGWTVLSIAPYLLGGGKFLSTWLSFRLFSLLSLVLLALTYRALAQKRVVTTSLTWLVLCNPLVLIEIISNSHNDLWMMVPAIVSLHLVSQLTSSKNVLRSIVLSGILLASSASIKLATLVLIPLWLLLVVEFLLRSQRRQSLSWLTRHWPLMASFLMFIPLVTLRSQQFHPWYLTWVIVWLPLLDITPTPVSNRSVLDKIMVFGSKVWIPSVVVLSLSSLLRYIPYLYAGTYEGNILWQQKMVSWVPFIVALVVFGLKNLLYPASPSSSSSPKSRR